jgi:hypothetical protein
MEYKDRQRIIDILQEHGDMIGNSSDEARSLIKEMKQIRCRNNTNRDKLIEDEMESLCERLSYEPSEENNKNRETDLIAIRDSVARVIFDKYPDHPKISTIVGEFFSKDRTTGIHMNKRSLDRIDSNDPLFMMFYSKLVVETVKDAA